MTAEPNLTVVFDLDGTLVDTAPDLCQALNAALRSHKFPMVDETMVRNRVGHGARRIIEEGMRLANRSGDADLFDALERTFLTHYEAHIADNSRPFPGAVAACRRLTARGVPLGICTNKRTRFSRLLLEELDLIGFFQAILGADALDCHKPDPRHLLETIDRTGGDPCRAVMIGDSVTDVLTAKAANVPVILVSHGYTETPASELGGSLVIDHFDELEAAIAKIF